MPKTKKNAQPRPEPSPDRRRYVNLYLAVNETYHDMCQRIQVINTMENDLQHDLMKIEEALEAAKTPTDADDD